MSENQPTKSQTTAIAGPWVAEQSICDDPSERGLAVIAVLPELARTPGSTPTRGMVAWVHSGLGACETDAQAIATARLIAAAPAMRDALQQALPGLRDLVNQQCPDPDVAARDKRVLALVTEALNV